MLFLLTFTCPHTLRTLSCQIKGLLFWILSKEASVSKGNHPLLSLSLDQTLGSPWKSLEEDSSNPRKADRTVVDLLWNIRSDIGIGIRNPGVNKTGAAACVWGNRFLPFRHPKPLGEENLSISASSRLLTNVFHSSASSPLVYKMSRWDCGVLQHSF